MPKSKIFQREFSSGALVSRKQIKNMLMNKYYSIYMNNYKIGGMDYQQKDYFLKRYWAEGSIACFKLEGSKGALLRPEGLGVFCPFVAGYWNIYDFPTKVSLVNTRGVKFIPVGLQEVDKDVVIGYAQRNRKPVVLIVENYVDRMTDVLMVINTNLKSHKMPWLVAVNPEDEAKMKTLFDKLDNDDPQLFIDSDSADKMKALISGAPFIIDKLWGYYQALENELREFLGFGNIGVNEKKEHLINSEVEANNAIIEANKACLLDTIKEFFERIKDVLGITYTIEMNEPEIKFEDESEEDEEDTEKVEDKE